MPVKNAHYYKSGDDQLDLAIENLLFVDEGDHKNSDRYKRMSKALTDLSKIMSKYFPAGKNGQGGAAPILTADNLAEIREAYAEASRKCADYMRWKVTSRFTGYGRGRYDCVKEIQKILNRDMEVINGTELNSGQTLPAILSSGRTTEIRLEDKMYNLSTVGRNINTRLPLEVTSSLGRQKGFFTEDFRIKTAQEYYDDLKKDHDFVALNADRMLGNVEGINGLDKEMFEERCIQLSKKATELRDSGLSYADLIRDKSKFTEAFEGIFTEAYGKKNGKKLLGRMAESQFTRRDFVSFFQDLANIGSVRSDVKAGKFKEGTSIPERSVGLSRLADLLGIPNVVAKAYKMKVRDAEGNLREGVFEELAEGSNSKYLKQGDLIGELGKDTKLINKGKVKQQIADLQVLSYVGGRMGLQPKDLIFNVQDYTGVGDMVLSGIKSVGNDRALGLADDASMKTAGLIALPEDMKVISRSTLEALNTLDEHNLTVAFRDLSITQEEIQGVLTRARNVLQAVNDKKIEVVNDEYAYPDYYKLTDKQVKGKAKDAQPDKNLFEVVEKIPEAVKQAKPAGREIKFNKAAAVEADYTQRDADKPIYMRDLSNKKAALIKIRNDLETLDKAYPLHINGGTYKWMDRAIRDVIALTEQFEESVKYKDKGKKQLSDMDAKQMDGLYRQMREATAKYIAEHRDATSDLGTGRLKLAQDAYAIRTTRMPEPSLVKEIKAQDVPGTGKEPAQKADQKPERSIRKEMLDSNQRGANKPAEPQKKKSGFFSGWFS